ncbi:MAG TPA: hypothetical protein GXZ47_02950 [Treponema sp.]|nr:hypothetical protein [Treponema sp.]
MAQIISIILLLLTLVIFSREYYFFIRKNTKKKRTVLHLVVGYTAFFLLPVFLPPIANFAPTSLFRMLAVGLLDIHVFIYFPTLTTILWFLRVKPQYWPLPKRNDQRRTMRWYLILLSLYMASSGLSPQYVDLTHEQVHSVRPYTKKILNHLDSECLITWYRSAHLSETPQFRTISHLLSSYERENPKWCTLIVRDPNTQKSPEFPEQIGLLPLNSDSYSGILIEYRGKYHLLPSTIDYFLLEYELTKALESLILYQGNRTNPVQMLVLGNPNGYEYLQIVLEHAGFSLIPPINPEIALDPKIPLILVGSEYCSEGTLAAIKTFILQGGAAVFFVSGISIDTMETWSALPKTDDPILTLLESRGIGISPQLLLDEQNYRIDMPAVEGDAVQSVSYPYWIRVTNSGFLSKHVVFSGVSSLQFYWPSPIFHDVSKTIMPLIQTTNCTELANPPFFTHPLRDKAKFLISTKGRYPLSVFLEKPSRILVIADEYCVSNLIDLSASYDNLLFFINCVEWISGNEALTSIKRTPQRVLPFLHDYHSSR